MHFCFYLEGRNVGPVPWVEEYQRNSGRNGCIGNTLFDNKIMHKSNTIRAPLAIKKDPPVEENVFPAEAGQVERYTPSFDRDFAERLLGRRQRKDIPRITRQRLTEQEKRVRQLVQPRLTWNEFYIADIGKNGVTVEGGEFLASRNVALAFRGAERIAVFIATVGREVDAEIDRMMAERKLADAYVADALASAAVESLVDRFHKEMAEKCGRLEHYVGLRFSPGYCDWPVTDQQKLFGLLDHRSVGVELGDTFLMTPRKSLSGVFGIFSNIKNSAGNDVHNPCRRCGKKDCIARRVDATVPVHSE